MFMSGAFDFFFIVIFLIVIGTITLTLFQNIKTWNKNNHSPRLNVNAKIVSKRLDVTYHHHTNDNMSHHTTSTTYYYVTFEVESGDRMELRVKGNEYGMLVEGDEGELVFQGTRYISFQRK